MNRGSIAKVKVELMGQTYTLKGETSEQHIIEVARLVDDKMRTLSAKNPSLDLTKTAVLAAINLADEYLRLKQEYEDLLKLLEAETGSQAK